MKKEIVVISLQRLKTFLAQCVERFAAKDHTHDIATEQKDGFMSSNSVKDIEAIIAKLNNFGKLVDFDGGEPDNTEYNIDLDGGEPDSIYALEDPDFIITLAAADWKYEETSGRYVQTIMDTRISGLNNYYIGSTLNGTESDEKASEYNNNFKYIVAGQSSGTSLIIEAISAPTIDLSVKICKM